MKNLLIALFLVAAGMQQTNAQQMNVATFNLRYDNPKDSGNLWKDRRQAVSALIRFHDFDIFGTQEALKNQLDDVASALPGYTYYGKGRDDGKDAGEHSAIFFKKDKFKLLDKGDFWLSETPDKPGLGWDATCCNRICSWVRLEDVKTKKSFYFFNVHYDHQGKVARRESSKLILAKIAAIAGKQPAILTGDFNARRESEPYKLLAASSQVKDAITAVKVPYALNSSYNGFGRDLDAEGVIDHIFITPQFTASKWGILTDTYQGKFPSDHFPVMTVLQLKK
ncbi:endonuclease/exonuclease/phosphatase family protein [Chitinophaga sedimenti]|uniref:endonuclease/exonuclease/phosphatase family protein n=1 Tax=Chitinophaga sedimenti TaxID=2033606 RepID=UPI002005F5BE|nr:endonuclease/exonuclease/phosphatase family protein [Chitinophaga sedimenti]MCK7557690.1 endonuclease/exonuclease/phosphatase family protein [Chitinophaga sedimenti]